MTVAKKTKEPVDLLAGIKEWRDRMRLPLEVCTNLASGATAIGLNTWNFVAVSYDNATKVTTACVNGQFAYLSGSLGAATDDLVLFGIPGNTFANNGATIAYDEVSTFVTTLCDCDMLALYQSRWDGSTNTYPFCPNIPTYVPKTSGSVGPGLVGSGAVTSGMVGSGAIVSGNIGSGQVGTNVIASGTTVSFARGVSLIGSGVF